MNKKSRFQISEINFPEEYEFLDIVGSGSFGKVFRAIKREDNLECAIKVKNNKI